MSTVSGHASGLLQTQLKPGTIKSVQRGSTKAECRVQWSRQLGPNELQAANLCSRTRTFGVLKVADEALYRDKEEDRDRIVVAQAPGVAPSSVIVLGRRWISKSIANLVFG